MRYIGIFADVSNLYYCIGMKYPNRKLDYVAYRKYVEDLGIVKHCIAYGAQLDNEAAGFIHCLKEAGYSPKYKCPKTYKTDDKIRRKADWDVGIAIDIVQLVLDGQLDMVLLGSADGDLCPLVEWVQSFHKITVVVLACGISRDLRLLADKAIEIPESLLETKHVTIQRETGDSSQRTEPVKLIVRGRDRPVSNGLTIQPGKNQGT